LQEAQTADSPKNARSAAAKDLPQELQKRCAPAAFGASLNPDGVRVLR
jgi:hypothetical protein